MPGSGRTPPEPTHTQPEKTGLQAPPGVARAILFVLLNEVYFLFGMGSWAWFLTVEKKSWALELLGFLILHLTLVGAAVIGKWVAGRWKTCLGMSSAAWGYCLLASYVAGSLIAIALAIAQATLATAAMT